MIICDICAIAVLDNFKQDSRNLTGSQTTVFNICTEHGSEKRRLPELFKRNKQWLVRSELF